ncbi:MAG: helix-turn-helix domain-containing protein [Candidatus Liptonbacteria bacterium]
MKQSEIKLEKELKALANRRRLGILRYLKTRKDASVGDIAREIKLSLKSTSKHLAILAALDIVGREQRNIQMFYFLNYAQNQIAKYILSIL